MNRIEENAEMIKHIRTKYQGNPTDVSLKMAADLLGITQDISKSLAMLAEFESKKTNLEAELDKARRASDEYVRDHRLIQFMLDFLAFETKDKEIEQIYARWMMEGGRS